MSEIDKGGLGKGLSALLPSPAQPPANQHGPSLREIPLDEIAANPMQPRTQFDHEALEELAESIRAVGVLQPVVVRRMGAGYQLIMGERRVRAARIAGHRMIPAIVRDTADASMLRDALIENIQRQNLNPIEEAAALRALVQEHQLTHDVLAERVGMSRAAVSNAIRLLSLTPSVQSRVASGVLSAAHGRTIAALSDPSAQERVALRVSAENLSVRATEELVRMLSATGEIEMTRRARHTRTPKPAGILEVEHLLTDMLDTPVRIEGGRRGRGRLVVEFADQQDLDRIFRIVVRA
ncbi:MAG: ParB/RepB/Spo0J family partition protein [Actinomycetota bacterium]